MANKNPNKTYNKTWNRAGFEVKWQPSPEAKSAWWERKRQAKKILDHMMKMWDMTKEERIDYVKKNPDELKMNELINVKYMEEILKGKLLVDWMNRHIPYAPQKTEVTGEDWAPITIESINDNTTFKQLEEMKKQLINLSKK